MKQNFLMLPKIDFAFKELMQNEQVRIGFLSAVLKLAPEEITDTVLLNTHLRKRHDWDKLGIVDVLISLKDGTQIDIEIQLAYLKAWPERSLFYLSRMYSAQLEKGVDYHHLKKCIGINILDFVLFQDTDRFYSTFHFREDSEQSTYSDQLELHIIELPKMPKEQEEADDILLWVRFLNAEREEEFEMLAQKNKYIEEACDQLKIISQDKLKKMEYEAREKALRDYNAMRNQSIEEGLEEGIRLGLEQGLEQGVQKGIEQGTNQAKLDIARRLINLNLTTEQIAEYTGLSFEEIKNLP